MDAVINIAVLIMVFEGYQVRAESAGVLERTSLFPAEGLASGKCEGERQFRLGEVKWDPGCEVCRFSSCGGDFEDGIFVFFGGDLARSFAVVRFEEPLWWCMR